MQKKKKITFLSGGAVTLTLESAGAKLEISYCILSHKPGKVVVPPIIQ